MNPHIWRKLQILTFNAQSSGPLGAWGQVALAALAQNVATGFTFGSFGSMVLAIERDYHASRAQSSLAISLAVVSLSLCGMAAGRVIHRVALRGLMIAGALLGAAGFAVCALARGPGELLAAYALLIGPGAALLGVLPSMTLATRWAPADRRGLAMGLVNLPLLVMIVPLVLGPWLARHGPRSAYAGLAIGLLVLVPVLLAVRGGGSAAPVALTRRPRVATDPRFWALTLAIGILTGAGTMKLAHFVPLLTGQGRSFAEANLLLALSGGAGLAGSLLFGRLTDRIGALPALALNAAVQALVWTIFLAPVTLPVLVFDAVVVGACGGGVQAAFGTAVANTYGAGAFGRTFGLFQLSTLPFLFGMTPLVSMLYEHSGSYVLPMECAVGSLVLAALVFGALARTNRPIEHQG